MHMVLLLLQVYDSLTGLSSRCHYTGIISIMKDGGYRDLLVVCFFVVFSIV